MEVVSLMISESTTTLFSLIISETTGVFALSNPCVTRGSSFVEDFSDGIDSVFDDYFSVHRGCLRY